MQNIKFLILIPIFILLFCNFSRGQIYCDTGIASYYGKEFHGKKTASGEIYNMNNMTAAHPTLPFQTYIKVTNLVNNKTVIVKINDRGPHSKNRIIDLSKAAANTIGLTQSGTAKVRIEKIDHYMSGGNPNQSSPTISNKEESAKITSGKIYDIHQNPKSIKGYVIQVYSFSDQENAFKKLKTLESNQKTSFYCEVAKTKNGNVYRVISNAYSAKTDAEKHLTQLKKSGIKGIIRQL